MNTSKLSPDLSSRLTQAGSSEVLDVILELRPQPEQARAVGPRSRAEEIAAREECFSRGTQPVEQVIEQIGGEVTGRAWINQTVQARVPAHGVHRLSDLEEVALLDTPHAVEAG